MTDVQLFCPVCIAVMLLTETAEEELVYICTKCGFQLNLSLTKEE